MSQKLLMAIYNKWWNISINNKNSVISWKVFGDFVFKRYRLVLLAEYKPGTILLSTAVPFMVRLVTIKNNVWCLNKLKNQNQREIEMNVWF